MLSSHHSLPCSLPLILYSHSLTNKSLQAGKAICFPAIAFSDTDQLKVIIPTGGALTIRTWDAFLKELPAVNVALPKDVCSLLFILSSLPLLIIFFQAIVDSLKLSSTAKYGVVSFNVKSQFDIKIFTNDVVNPLLSLHAEKDEVNKQTKII